MLVMGADRVEALEEEQLDHGQSNHGPESRQ